MRNGEDASHRLLQLQITTRAPARTFESRGDEKAFSRPFSRPTGPKPHRTSRVTSRLTAQSQLWRVRPRSYRRLTKVRAPPAPGWGFSIDEPRGRCPFTAAFSTASEEDGRTSDAPCREAARPKPRDSAETASTASSFKRDSLFGRSAFPRRVARSAIDEPRLGRSLAVTVPTRFTHRLERGPATVSRTLPPGTGFRRSFALRYWRKG